MEFFYALLISIVINVVLFAFAYRLQTDKVTDLSYAISFVAVVLYAYIVSSHTAAQAVVVAMVVLWASRLGTYLVMRIRKIGRDTRFDDRRNHFGKFATFWTLQAISVPIILLPTLMLLASPTPSLLASTYIGISVWACGLAIETFADYQKFKFTSITSNRGRWIDTGLWKYSRHPNYLGEILVWVGIYFFALPNLNLSQNLMALLGPVYITVLLIFVSGIPILEKAATRKWGNNPAYEAYKVRTGILFPKKLI